MVDRMRPIDRGGAVLLEVDFRKRSPHASIEYYDPTSAEVTVTDPSSTVVVTSQVMSATNASSAGLWHAIIQTSTDWVIGLYETKVIAFDGVIRDYNVEPRVFELE